ncbi:hypothetical protein [[Eubacterium] cellulosolvens]
MVQKKKKFIFGLVLIVVILLLLTHTPIISAEGEGVIPVTNNLNHQVEPVIYGDYIVWTDYRNDNGSGLNSDIYLYDLSTHQERAICTEPGRQVRPDIYGTWVVWEDNRNGPDNWDLYGYDLITGTEIRITDNFANQNNPAIFKTLVVWEDVGRLGASRHDNDIFIKDLTAGTSGEDYALCTADGEQIDADIYGNIVVWTDRRSGVADIYLYDLSVDTDSDGEPNYRDSDDDGDNIPDLGDPDPDPAERPLVTNPDKQHNPAIYDDLIVYQDHRSGNSDIYMFNLKNNTEVALVTTPDEENLPRIYGEYVVFEKQVGTEREIYYYDLTTSESYQVTFQPSNQEFPDIYNKMLVWADYRNDKDGHVTSTLVDNGDIYMYHIPKRDIKGSPPLVTDLTVVPESVEVDGEVTIIVEATDPDGDDLLYVFTSTGGTIESVDGNKATWRAPGVSGYYNISAYATDGEFFSNTMHVMVQVYKNSPPEILNVSLNPDEVKTGRAMTITVQASDPDDDKLVYEFICSEGELSGCDSEFDNEVTWTAPEVPGNYQIVIKVSDYSQELGTKLSTDEEIITISVLPRKSSNGGDSGFLPGFELDGLVLIFIISLVVLLKFLKIHRNKIQNQ